MQEPMRIRTTVLPGGEIVIMNDSLTVGQVVEVVISYAATPSAWQIISSAPGQRVFEKAKDVEDYIKEERASWDH